MAGTAQSAARVITRASGSKFYQPELDGLRFFAFFGVFLPHSLPTDVLGYLRHPGFPPALVPFMTSVRLAGAFGVDLFFVLSSYLITELLLRERASSGTVHVKAFYVRRAFRIWPLYFTFLLLAAFVGWFDPAQRLGWGYQCGYIFFAGNWACMLLGWPGGITDPLWSISVEEQFYLMWPLTMRKLSVKQIAWAAVAFLAISSVTRLLLGLTAAPRVMIWVNTLARLDPIACGALLAAGLHGSTPKLSQISRGCMFLGGVGALLLTAYYCRLDQSPTPLLGSLIGYPLVAVACTTLLLAALRSAEQPSWLLKNSLTTYLGRISYGLYVFHSAALYLFTRYRGLLPDRFTGIWCVALSFASTILIASISYRVLEQPFLRLKRKFTYVESGS